MGTTQHWYCSCFPGIKWLGCEVDHTLLLRMSGTIALHTLCAFMACRATTLGVHIAIRFTVEISRSLTHFVIFHQSQSLQIKVYIPVLLCIWKLLTHVKYMGIYVLKEIGCSVWLVDPFFLFLKE
jgi:hypothetical protein